MSAATTNLAPHKLALGSKAKLFGFEDEGLFTIVAHTGHNMFNNLPAYSIRCADGSDGEILTRVTEAFLLPQP